MDRMRPAYDRQQSSTASPRAPSSPIMSPLTHHARSGSTGLTTIKRAPNNATKAAAQRLAQVMANSGDDDDNEDDLDLACSSGGIGLTGGGRAIRPRSPMSARTAPQRAPSGGRSSLQTTAVEQNQSDLPAPGGRLAPSIGSVEQPSSARAGRLSQSVNSSEQPPSARSSAAGRASQFNNSGEQPLSARSSMTNRSSQAVNNFEQPPSARSSSAARPQFGPKSVHMVPASVSISLRPTPCAIASENPVDIRRDKRMSLDMGSMNFKESGNQRSTALEDEVEMLQEENESLLEKLRLAEERCEEAAARARELEKQVANLGKGVALEGELLSRKVCTILKSKLIRADRTQYAVIKDCILQHRKEAALQQREAALRIAAETCGVTNHEVAALRIEAEIARDEATSAMEHLQETESELRSLQQVTQQIILTQEEMEELVLKQCWLAQYWGLCVKHGIYAEIAGARHEYWSSFAPHPVEFVLAAGQKAKEDKGGDDPAERDNDPQNQNELSGEGNVENMLLVEKGLLELVTLKVEDAVALTWSQIRRSKSLKAGLSEDLKLPTEGQFEAFELSPEESEDVFFKQAWLTYFWRRAKRHGVEAELANERLRYWINHNTKSPTSNDAFVVDRGLAELRKFNIEARLWGASRKIR